MNTDEHGSVFIRVHLWFHFVQFRNFSGNSTRVPARKLAQRCVGSPGLSPIPKVSPVFLNTLIS